MPHSGPSTVPLLKDEKEQPIIPREPLFNILAKFNGIAEQELQDLQGELSGALPAHQAASISNLLY